MRGHRWIAATLTLCSALIASCGSDTSGEPPGARVAGVVTFHGAEAGDGAGAVAGGDFNGDGSMDVALAASLADGPDNARPDAGEAYLLLGPLTPGETRDAALGEQALTIHGADPGDRLGHAVAAGDFNGDGLDDLALAAPFADGPKESRKDSGEVYVIFGSARLGATAPLLLDIARGQQTFTVYGADADDLAGFTLNAADFDQDGLDDLIMGALQADGPDNGRASAGEVYVVLGRRQDDNGRIDLARGEQGVVAYGAAPGDELSRAGVGDFDGDGRPDLLLAAPFGGGPERQRPAAGEAYVVLGEVPPAIDAARDQADVLILGADVGDQMGHSVAVGDTNGDGRADVVLGALSSEGLDNATDLAGEVLVVLGNADPPPRVDATQGGARLVFGVRATDRLGRAVATGDVNGDGYDDLLLAAPGADADGGRRADAGEVYVFYGRPRPLPSETTTREADLTLAGEDGEDYLAHDAFGTPALAAADVNADGLDDILVTSPRSGGPDNSRPGAGGALLYIMAGR